MPQYLVANYLPDDFDPEAIDEIHALNREMIASGVRKFACGIAPARNAKTVRKQPDGTVLVTNGPYRSKRMIENRRRETPNRTNSCRKIEAGEV